MNYEQTLKDAKKDFEESILPALQDFVRIDNLEKGFEKFFYCFK